MLEVVVWTALCPPRRHAHAVKKLFYEMAMPKAHFPG